MISLMKLDVADSLCKAYIERKLVKVCLFLSVWSYFIQLSLKLAYVPRQNSLRTTNTFTKPWIVEFIKRKEHCTIKQVVSLFTAVYYVKYLLEIVEHLYRKFTGQDNVFSYIQFFSKFPENCSFIQFKAWLLLKRSPAKDKIICLIKAADLKRKCKTFFIVLLLFQIKISLKGRRFELRLHIW